MHVGGSICVFLCVTVSVHVYIPAAKGNNTKVSYSTV